MNRLEYDDAYVYDVCDIVPSTCSVVNDEVWAHLGIQSPSPFHSSFYMR